MTTTTAPINDTATMRAIVQRRYGFAPEEVLVLEDIATPAIKDDEVLVQVRAAGVDRGTWHLMVGLPRLMRYIGFGVRGPKTPTPGLDLAGTIVAVGKKVTGLAPGDEVFGAGTGSFAEYARAKAGKVAPKPANLSFAEAASAPVSALTAYQAVHHKAGVQPGEQVLVLGASGGVGSWVVKIAKASGAQVTGVARGSKLDFVRAIGADHTIDYTEEDPVDGQRRYDVVIDIGGNRPVRRLRRALTPKGRLIIVGGEDAGSFLGGIERNLRASLLSLFVSQKLTAFVSRVRGDDLAALRDLLASGAITPAIDRTYPLADAAAALRYLADGHARGKVVITV